MCLARCRIGAGSEGKGEGEVLEIDGNSLNLLLRGTECDQKLFIW